jgi:hypothetical protein
MIHIDILYREKEADASSKDDRKEDKRDDGVSTGEISMKSHSRSKQTGTRLSPFFSKTILICTNLY